MPQRVTRRQSPFHPNRRQEAYLNLDADIFYTICALALAAIWIRVNNS